MIIDDNFANVRPIWPFDATKVTYIDLIWIDIQCFSSHRSDNKSRRIKRSLYGSTVTNWIEIKASSYLAGLNSQ